MHMKKIVKDINISILRIRLSSVPTDALAADIKCHLNCLVHAKRVAKKIVDSEHQDKCSLLISEMMCMV